MLKRLQPRLYSISSSPLVDPHRVQLTVSVVRFDNLRGQAAQGRLLDVPRRRRAGRRGAGLRAARRRTSGRRPTRATPMIMVGPGTGVAPFLGFLQERRARGAPGRNWLFFGEQHRATDFYYERRADRAARRRAP